jgi:GNAT superfamily N-acetyltransferase
MSAEGRPAHAGSIEDDALHLAWSEAPWDTAVFGAPALQITRIQVRHEGAARGLIARFEAAREAASSPFVTCRLPHDCLRESMLLEERGFRFVEMLFQPAFRDLQEAALPDPGGLSVHVAEEADFAWAAGIAGQAFRHERFHADPRLPRGLGDRRYQNWVRNTAGHPAQRLLIIRDRLDPVAFFIVEQQGDGTCFWHLTAVAPDRQGRGYGSRVWAAMLRQARDSGATSVRTSITARNGPVLNLYARLHFRFSPPAMSFHWVRTE